MNKEKNKNMKMTRDYKRVIALLLGILAVIFLSVSSLAHIFSGYQEQFVDREKTNQQKLISQLADTCESMGEAGKSESVIIDYISSEIDASAGSYVFLISGNKVVFAKDKTTTSQISETTDKDSFLNELYTQAAVITLDTFLLNEKEYVIGRITDMNELETASDNNTYITYLVILFVVIIIIGIISVVGIASSWAHNERKIVRLNSQLEKRNAEFEKINTDKQSEKKIFTTSMVPVSEGDRYKQYQYKFYINARHAIYIDNVLGELHPHTWELTLNVIKTMDKFVEFAEVEKKVSEFIDEYQDKELNKIPPFDTINPTLENCSDYFKDRISEVLEADGFILLMMEMSETPSRSYVISMIDEYSK